MMHAINWFEIPTSDFDRAVTFYESIMNCTMRRIEVPGAQEPIPMALFPAEAQGISGALVYLKEHRPAAAGPLLYLNANPDLNIIFSRIEASGGRVIMPKTPLPNNFGYMALFFDSEDNHMGLHSME